MKAQLHRRSRRGGTFTFIVLAVSVLLLGTATILVEAIGMSYRRGAEQAQRVRLQEAAFAGVTWAKHAHLRQDALAAGRLRLAAATVEVTYAREGELVRVTSTAKSLRQWVTVKAVLKARKAGGPLQLETFDVSLVDPRSPGKTPTKTTAPAKTKTKSTRDF